MNRRDFLRLAGTAPIGLAAPRGVLDKLTTPSPDAWRTFTLTTHVEVLKPAGTTRVWLPTPLTVDTPYQKTLANDVAAPDGTTRLVESKPDGLGIVCVEFPAGVRPVVTLTSRVSTRNRSLDLSRRGT